MCRGTDLSPWHYQNKRTQGEGDTWVQGLILVMPSTKGFIRHKRHARNSVRLYKWPPLKIYKVPPSNRRKHCALYKGASRYTKKFQGRALRVLYVCKDIIVRKKNELMTTTTTTTEDSSGQSAPERGAASQPASQPAKGACVDCKEHATEPYVAHTTPVVLLFPCLPSLAASTHWPQQNTSRLTSFSSSYIASPLVHQNRLFVRARESDWRRAHTHTNQINKNKNTRPDFALLTVHIKKKERAEACSHTPNPSRCSFPSETKRRPKTKTKKKTKKSVWFCVCVCGCFATVFGILVGPFSGACVYPSGCRSTRRGGGRGGGGVGKWGMVFFFLRS
jgi:hypothetical protein